MFPVPISCAVLIQLLVTLWAGSSACGIFQARILAWVAISFSRGIFPIQGSNLRLLCLLHGQADSSPLSHLERKQPSFSRRQFV